MNQLTFNPPISGPHNIVYEKDTGRYRCLACRAVSLKRSVIDEIPCTKAKVDTFKEVPKRGETTEINPYTWVYTAPFLPKLGDTWLDHDGLFVFVELRDEGYAWIEVDTGHLRNGQLPLPGVGYNDAVVKMGYMKPYDNTLLRSKAMGIDGVKEAKEQVTSLLIADCIHKNMIIVSPVGVETTKRLSIDVTDFRAVCMALPRPSPPSDWKPKPKGWTALDLP